MGKQVLKFVNKSNNPNPAYVDNASSGFDLRAYSRQKMAANMT